MFHREFYSFDTTISFKTYVSDPGEGGIVLVTTHPKIIHPRGNVPWETICPGDNVPWMQSARETTWSRDNVPRETTHPGHNFLDITCQ